MRGDKLSWCCSQKKARTSADVRQGSTAGLPESFTPDFKNAKTLFDEFCRPRRLTFPRHNDNVQRSAKSSYLRNRIGNLTLVSAEPISTYLVEAIGELSSVQTARPPGFNAD
jgi:hypothetical protein